MPSPTRNPDTGIFQYRVRVPTDLVERAKGKSIMLPVDGRHRPVKIGVQVKVSLSTRDLREAKERFREVDAIVQTYWDGLRKGPQPLTMKQVYALAGEMRAVFIEAFDDEPGTPETWLQVMKANAEAGAGTSSLAIPTPAVKLAAMEKRFGGLVSAYLAGKGLHVDEKSRKALVGVVAEPLSDAARINMAKASGDYSDTGETQRYPKFVPTEVPQTATGKTAFKSIIDEEVRRRSLGTEGRTVNSKSISKFRRHTDAFEAHRDNKDAATITPQEVRVWVEALQTGGKLKNKTVGDYLSSVQTVLEWGREHDSAFHPSVNPASRVRGPTVRAATSGERAYTLEEAKRVLLSAREARSDSLRWLPWLCAYSGARIEEVAGLRKEDFFETGGRWFFHIRPYEGRDLKNLSSERRVPVHPALVEEGLLAFVEAKKKGGRLFTSSPSQAISRWLILTVKITRGVPPSHGWRHLFEDLCTAAGMSDTARSYITGRASGTSRDRYGRSDAMLPGLAAEMDKVQRLL
ncbi:DUF6538 domain-containing protein [Mesorhizobium zhangyense]|nr:DUF6538 domain-containing protein [Mesorhizobium zhangyense]